MKVGDGDGAWPCRCMASQKPEGAKFEAARKERTPVVSEAWLNRVLENKGACVCMRV